MRSYEAARLLFSTLSNLAWGLIVTGGLIGIWGGIAASDMMGRGAGAAPFFLGLLPGIIVALAGFLSLVLAQIGRAGVDTAEYSQQMLQLSRDQLEVSRQTLRQGEEVKNSFAALRSPTAHAPSATYADLKTEPDSATRGQVDAAPTPAVSATIDYKGRDIVALESGFRFSGMEFATLDAARSYVDQLGINPNAVLSSTS